MKRSQAIGFFDSGIGGLSVLADAVRQLPHERFLYLGDSANAPYGTKSDREVLALSLKAVDLLVQQGIKALVVACNTATGTAIAALREQYSFPIIGLEPALKVAESNWKGGSILVLATPLTLASAKYQSLSAKYGEHAIAVPCPGLMDFVEREELDSPALDAYLNDLFLPYREQAISAVVLGCTHYLFLKRKIQACFEPGVPVLDSNEGVIRQLVNKLKEFDLLAPGTAPGSVCLTSTGGDDKLAQMHRMLSLAQSQP